jgi:hypothetical protein
MSRRWRGWRVSLSVYALFDLKPAEIEIIETSTKYRYGGVRHGNADRCGGDGGNLVVGASWRVTQ